MFPQTLQCCAKSEPDLDACLLLNGLQDVELALCTEDSGTVRHVLRSNFQGLRCSSLAGNALGVGRKFE